jgi:hypothetical protein
MTGETPAVSPLLEASAIKMKPPTSRGCLRIPKQSYDV